MARIITTHVITILGGACRAKTILMGLDAGPEFVISKIGRETHFPMHIRLDSCHRNIHVQNTGGLKSLLIERLLTSNRIRT